MTADGPRPPPVPLPQYPDYNVLQSDSANFVTPKSDTNFVIGTTGPCPRFIGVTVTNYPYVLSKGLTAVGVSLTNACASFALGSRRALAYVCTQ